MEYELLGYLLIIWAYFLCGWALAMKAIATRFNASLAGCLFLFFFGPACLIVIYMIPIAIALAAISFGIIASIVILTVAAVASIFGIRLKRGKRG